MKNLDNLFDVFDVLDSRIFIESGLIQDRLESSSQGRKCLFTFDFALDVRTIKMLQIPGEWDRSMLGDFTDVELF